MTSPLSRVALINPPWRSPGHYGVRAGSRWPHFEDNGCAYMPFPFYLAYSAALLEKAGFVVEVLDGCATRESDETFERRLVAFRPDAIVQENATASIKTDLDWARRAKERTGAFLLMTGHHVAHMRNSLGEYPCIDALAGGEWEYTVLEACTRLREGKSLDGTLGLVHKAPGRVLTEERRPNIEHLDGLPFPQSGHARHVPLLDNPGG